MIGLSRDRICWIPDDAPFLALSFRLSLFQSSFCPIPGRFERVAIQSVAFEEEDEDNVVDFHIAQGISNSAVFTLMTEANRLGVKVYDYFDRIFTKYGEARLEISRYLDRYLTTSWYVPDEEKQSEVIKTDYAKT